MAEETISQEFRLNNIDETINYLIEEINGNEKISKKYKKVCTALSYIKLFLILASAITGCVSVSVSASVVVIPIEIMSSAVGLKICVITAAIKKYKSIIKKKKKKHNKIVLLAKFKLSIIEVLVFKISIDSFIIHDEFVLIIHVLKEYNKMKEEIKKLKTLSDLAWVAKVFERRRKFIEDFSLFVKQCYRIV